MTTISHIIVCVFKHMSTENSRNTCILYMLIRIEVCSLCCWLMCLLQDSRATYCILGSLRKITPQSYLLLFQQYVGSLHQYVTRLFRNTRQVSLEIFLEYMQFFVMYMHNVLLVGDLQNCALWVISFRFHVDKHNFVKKILLFVWLLFYILC